MLQLTSMVLGASLLVVPVMAADSTSVIEVQCQLWLHAQDSKERRTYPEVGEQVFRVLVVHVRGAGPVVLPENPADALEIEVTNAEGEIVPVDVVGARATFTTAAGIDPSPEEARWMEPGARVEVLLDVRPQGREQFQLGQYGVVCRLRPDRVTGAGGAPVEIGLLADARVEFVVASVQGATGLKELHTIRGMRAIVRRDFAEAISWYLEGARNVPDDDFWGPKLIDAYLRLGNEDEALEWFARCKDKLARSRREYGRVSMLDRVALVYPGRGARVEALRVLEMALPPDQARKALDNALDAQRTPP